jgi:hypothetical protein
MCAAAAVTPFNSTLHGAHKMEPDNLCSLDVGQRRREIQEEMAMEENKWMMISLTTRLYFTSSSRLEGGDLFGVVQRA